jgi:hypothetical protein
VKIEAQDFDRMLTIGGMWTRLRARLFLRDNEIVAVRSLQLCDDAGNPLPKFDVGTIEQAEDGSLKEPA